MYIYKSHRGFNKFIVDERNFIWISGVWVSAVVDDNDDGGWIVNHQPKRRRWSFQQVQDKYIYLEIFKVTWQIQE